MNLYEIFFVYGVLAPISLIMWVLAIFAAVWVYREFK